MIAIDARETAPASVSQHVFYNTTGTYTGIYIFTMIGHRYCRQFFVIIATN